MEIPIPKLPCKFCGNEKLLLVMRSDVKTVIHFKCLICKADVSIKAKNVMQLPLFDIEKIYSKTIDEFIDICDAYESKHPSLSDKDFKKLDNLISNSKNQDEIEKNTFPDIRKKDEEGPVVLTVPPEEVEEVIEADVKFSKDLKNSIIDIVSKRYSFLSYKTIFDPDDKGLGIKVLPEDIVDFVIEEFINAVNSVNLPFNELDKWNSEKAV